MEELVTPKVQPKILLVEDDTNFGKVLKNYLELNDFVVELARDGILGLNAFKTQKFDICLLDVMMPNMDGFTLGEEIRNIDPEIPLFFLTAKNMKDDVLTGYKLGADDYILKPFDSEVLIHKIKIVLKRNQEFIEKNPEVFHYQFSKFTFDARVRKLSMEGAEMIYLSPKENGLLRLLCEHKNDILPRELALKKVWGSDTYFNGRSMDVFISKLRKYIKDDDQLEIVNVHGNGFRLLDHSDPNFVS
jgi:two-component system, OmpR family, response regulator